MAKLETHKIVNAARLGMQEGHKTAQRLLLVADNPSYRAACRRALSAYPDGELEIIEAETGQFGLKLAMDLQPDCILLDHDLQDINVAEFLTELAKGMGGIQAPVMLLLAANKAEVAVDTAKLDVCDPAMESADNESWDWLTTGVFRVLREQQALSDKACALEQLRETSAKYRSLVEQIPAITYIASLETPAKLKYLSPQIVQLGFPLDFWLNDPQGLFKQVHAEDLAMTMEAYAHAHEFHAPLRCEYRLRRGDGQYRWFLDEANVVRDESGVALFLQGVLVDITRDKEIEQELYYYRQRLEELVVQRTAQFEKQCAILKTANANLDETLHQLRQANSALRATQIPALFQTISAQTNHDPLTGLINRTEFESRLRRILAGALQDNSKHVLCYLNLDHFKQLNAGYGQAAGDELLRKLAGLLTSRLRQRDSLARIGGDEFALLLEHVSLNQAASIARQLCETVRNYSFNWQDRPVTVSVSIGLAQITGNVADIGVVQSAADAACYMAKQMGRDRVHIFEFAAEELN